MKDCHDQMRAEVHMKRAWDEVEMTQARVEIVPALPCPTLICTCITAKMLKKMRGYVMAVNYTCWSISISLKYTCLLNIPLQVRMRMKHVCEQPR